MVGAVTQEQVKEMAAQRPVASKSQLVGDVTELLYQENAVGSRRGRLKLAERLLAEVEDIEDDSQGEFDAAEDIRRLRDERDRSICPNAA